jgi:hypothetical protein
MNHVHFGVETGLSILFYNSGKPAYLSAEPFAGYLPDALELALGRYRKSGLDDVYSQPIELPGDYELLIRGERYAGRLLSVTKGGIEDPYRFTGNGPYIVEDDPSQRFLAS